MKIARFLKKHWFTYLLILLTGVGITVTGILFEQSFFRMWPLYNSLFIMALSARANRYSCLFGGLNSVLYGIVYWNFGLMGSFASAMFFSCPVQLVTFVLYHRRKYGSSTLFRKMAWRWRGVAALGFGCVWLGAYIVIQAIGGSYALLDTTVSLFGIFITFLTMFAFIEAPVLNILNSTISIALYVQMIADGATEQWTYFVYSVYCLICVVRGAIRRIALYREQQALKTEKNIQQEVEHENSMA